MVEKERYLTSTFTKYRKTEGETKILLLYLLLNNYDLSKIKTVEEIVQQQMFGVEFRKIYGITSEYVDVQKIEQELTEIRIPVVCSPQSFEMYANAEIIHAYKPSEVEKPLYINDMGVISSLMVITKNCIVSANKAVTLENADNKGFMYFVDYVLNGYCKIEAWEMSYQDKEFRIYYTSEDEDGNEHKELLYHALELDQTSTYKLVLYVIKKTLRYVEEFVADNFIEETWQRSDQ